MSAAAHSLFYATSLPAGGPDRSTSQRAVESRMRHLTRAGAAAPSIQLATQHHLQSGGARRRVTLALATCDALGIERTDAIWLAACAELLHNASLVHDDVQDRTTKRHGVDAVWARYGDDIAICAGDLLISAAYAALASVSYHSQVADLVQAAHAAVAITVDGQAQDIALGHIGADSFEVYENVVTRKSAPLLGLPIVLALTYAGRPDAVPVARNVAEDLALACQIADDLEDIESDCSSNPDRACLNVLSVMANAGVRNPIDAAAAQAYAALRRCTITARRLPGAIGISLSPSFKAVADKVETVTL